MAINTHHFDDLAFEKKWPWSRFGKVYAGSGYTLETNRKPRWNSWEKKDYKNHIDSDGQHEREQIATRSKEATGEAINKSKDQYMGMEWIQFTHSSKIKRWPSVIQAEWDKTSIADSIETINRKKETINDSITIGPDKTIKTAHELLSLRSKQTELQRNNKHQTIIRKNEEREKEIHGASPTRTIRIGLEEEAAHTNSLHCLCPSCTTLQVIEENQDSKALSEQIFALTAPGTPTRAETSNLTNTFYLHSKPSSSFTIYLDFDGYESNSTIWENDSDGDDNLITRAFYSDLSSQSAQTEIQSIWKGISEDFSPFDINVTTEDPGIEKLTKSGDGDTQWGIRVVFTYNQNWGDLDINGNPTTIDNAGGGGTAYYNSFNWGSNSGGMDEPVFSFNRGVYAATETGSHEVGHALNLRHDGTSTSTYYQGHGSEETSWGSIMGAPFIGADEVVTTWSQGDYFDANNQEDDLAIITSQNGFYYQDDDHSNMFSGASWVDYLGPNSENSNRIDIFGFGIIETNQDYDYFSIQHGGGILDLNISSVSRAYISDGQGNFSTEYLSPIRPNLDIAASLYRSDGFKIAESNPNDFLYAEFINLDLIAGDYYLEIQGVGVGDPYSETPTGYTSYASLGQYQVTGSVGVSGLKISAVAVDGDKAEGDEGTTSFTFHILLSSAQTENIIVDWSVLPSESGQNSVENDDFNQGLPSGNVTFVAGETTKIISVEIAGDYEVEADEYFTVRLSNPRTSLGESIGEIFSDAIGIIRSDDASLEGTVWLDQDQSGTSGLEEGEKGVDGTTVFLDDNHNGIWELSEQRVLTDADGNYKFFVDPGVHTIALQLSDHQQQTYPAEQIYDFDPDNYSEGMVLNNVDPKATFSTTFAENVTAINSTWVSTGSQGFGHNGSYGWYENQGYLRIDFSVPVNEASIDIISDDSSDRGVIYAYNNSGSLIDSQVSADLGTGQVETLSVNSLTNDIAYVLVSGEAGQIVGLDNLKFKSSGQGDGVPITVDVEAETRLNLDFGVYNTDNEQPIAYSDQYNLDEDTNLTLGAPGVMENDSNPNGTSLNATLVTSVTQGELVFNQNGAFSYTPRSNYYGTDSFQYTVNDGTNTSNLATVNLTISQINDAPVAVADFYEAFAGQELIVSASEGLLSNDADVDGDSITVILGEWANQGEILELQADGSFRFLAAPGYSGNYSFSYAANDGTVASEFVPVTVNVVNPPNIVVTPVQGTIDAEGRIIVDEDGSSYTFMVALASIPTGTVEVSIQVDDVSEASISTEVLIFNEENWQGSSTSEVTITGLGDHFSNETLAEQQFTVLLTAAGGNYNGITKALLGINQDLDKPLTETYQAISDNFSDQGLNAVVVPSDGTGSVAAVRAEDSSQLQITEGTLMLSSLSLALDDVVIASSISGSFANTHNQDNISQILTEVESGGRKSTRTTYLDHGWTFSSPNASRKLFIDATWNSSITFDLYWNTTLIGKLDSSSTLDQETDAYVFDLDLNNNNQYDDVLGNGTLYIRTSELNRVAGERNRDQISIDWLSLEREGLTTQAIQTPYLWNFDNLESVQYFDVSATWTDSSEEIILEYSRDSGEWQALTTLPASNTGLTTIDLIALGLTEGLSGNVRVRAFDSDRLESDEIQGSLSIDYLGFRKVINDLRPPVEISFESMNPAEGLNESGPTSEALIFKISDPQVEDIKVYFSLSGTSTPLSDYTHNGDSDVMGNFVTIASGTTEAHLQVTVIDDNEAEGPETIEVSIVESDELSYRPGLSSSVSTVINDNDINSYAPESLTLISGILVAGDVSNLAKDAEGVQTLQEVETSGNPRSRYTYIDAMYNFGYVDNVTQLHVSVSSFDYGGAPDDFISLTPWLNGNPILDSITGSPLEMMITNTNDQSLSFSAPLSGEFQLRVTDQLRVPDGERFRNLITFDQINLETSSLQSGPATSSLYSSTPFERDDPSNDAIIKVLNDSSDTEWKIVV